LSFAKGPSGALFTVNRAAAGPRIGFPCSSGDSGPVARGTVHAICDESEPS
jgi:hypothetical protein